MHRMLPKLALIVVGTLTLSPASAQMPDFTGMDLNAMNDDWNARQNGQMNQMVDQMIQQVLADPQAQEVIASGACGSGSPEQLAYIYGATGGCTPQGFDQFNQDTRDISGRERAFSDSLYPN